MAEISLRPMALRPGGAGAGMNPFAKFGKGAAPTKAARAPAVDEADMVKKPPGEIVRYSRNFLLKFSQKFSDLPKELDPNSSEAIINKDDPNQEGALSALQNTLPAADDSDDRDWRARTQLPAEPQREGSRQQQPQDSQQQWQSQAQPQQQQQQQQQPSGGTATPAPAQQNGPTGGAVPRSDSTSQLQSAADLGKKAWMPGTTSAEGDASALKQVKGILNKLTPEKFDRLLVQLVAAVTSVDVLNGLIKLIFLNAVEQPTFVDMYATLCKSLVQQLPELAPPTGETKPRSFQRLLLDTCQDEWEATGNSRLALEKVSAFERDAAERKVKQRTIGTIRLIAELYKQEVVKEPVVHVCIGELMGDAKAKPVDDNIESLCEMLTIAGKKLEESSRVPKRVEGYFAGMEKLAKDDRLAPRIRFLVRDVLDLRRMKWIPRTEKLKAKKLDEIHAQAHAELGMVPALQVASLAPLPGLAQLNPTRKIEEEVDLFPAFRSGGGEEDWKKLIGSGAGGKGASALLGDYAEPAAEPAAASNATPPQTSAAPAVQYLKGLTDEERERRADGLFTEYLSAADESEALLSAQELAAPGFLPTLVQRGVLKLLDLMRPREQEIVRDLVVRLPSLGAYSAEDLQKGLGLVTDGMDDLMLDAPLAPKLCGDVLGRALLEGVLPPTAILELAKPIEGGETRRALFGAALQFVKAEGGDDKLRQLTSELKGSSFLEADPELDPPDLPSVADFLAAQGLSAVPA